MHALTLVVPADAVEPLSDALSDEHGALAVSVEDADAGSAAEQAVFDEPGIGATGRWKRALVTALFADEAAATRAATRVAAGDGADTDVAAVPRRVPSIRSIAVVDDEDWVRLTQAQFGPSEIVPGFWIVPSWSQVPAHAGTVIRLDPGRAFGTGTHPTTRMCLRWLAGRHAAGAAGWPRVLDYGTGSGVLAIAAGRFGAAEIDAVDIDPTAVEAAAANALANGIALRCGAPEIAAGRYALVLANILATPLKLLAPLLAQRMSEGGELVLSGILARQADELRAAYAPWLPLAVAESDDGWILMTGTAPRP